MFYDGFIKLCTNKGVKPSIVADKIGISRGTITNWKKNRNTVPNSDVLKKLSNYFDVSMDFLLNAGEYNNESNYSVSAELGLWDSSISNIKNIKNSTIDIFAGISLPTVLNMFLSNEKTLVLFQTMWIAILPNMHNAILHPDTPDDLRRLGEIVIAQQDIFELRRREAVDRFAEILDSIAAEFRKSENYKEMEIALNEVNYILTIVPNNERTD